MCPVWGSSASAGSLRWAVRSKAGGGQKNSMLGREMRAEMGLHSWLAQRWPRLLLQAALHTWPALPPFPPHQEYLRGPKKQNAHTAMSGESRRPSPARCQAIGSRARGPC